MPRPSAPAPILPSRLDDRQSFFDTRRFDLPMKAAMARVRRAIEQWETERDAIRSVMRDHATVELDVSRWTSLCVRVEAVEADEGKATAICAAITVRATMSGLALGVLLLNTLVGIPAALVLRHRERTRALTLGGELVRSIFSALDEP